LTEIIKIYGAPGTGKTTALINQLRKELEEDNNLTLKDVVFVSFSNSAIDEVCDRIGITRNNKVAPYFRTLHGLCLKNLITLGEISIEKIREMQRFGFVEGIQSKFCKEEGIPFEREDGCGASDALGNRVFTTWSKVLGEFYPETRDVQKCLDTLYNLNCTYGEIVERWLKFKELTATFDYNDLLIETYENGIEIDARIGFFDEAQDFNRLEFEIVERTIDSLEKAYLAGDDDQAIYGWKGAKPDFFLDFKGNEIVLDKTYRLPPEIWQFAQNIINQVERRKEKPIQPVGEKGFVRILPKMNLKEFLTLAVKTARKYPSSKVFFLVRTNRMVYHAQAILVEYAIPFKRLKGYSIWDKEFVTAWNVVAKLRSKQPLNRDELEFLVEHANSEIIPNDQKEILRNLIKAGNIPIQVFDALRRLPILDLLELRKRDKKLLEKAWKPIDFGRINLN
jgi:DNA helicase-2/ATP-dependent DNA helicase PcrA